MFDSGQMNLVEFLAKNNAETNFDFQYGITLLHIAVENGIYVISWSN